jgi:archaellum component FlaC
MGKISMDTWLEGNYRRIDRLEEKERAVQNKVDRLTDKINRLTDQRNNLIDCILPGIEDDINEEIKTVKKAGDYTEAKLVTHGNSSIN